MRIIGMTIVAVLFITSPVHAGETLTFTYDAHGRRVWVSHSDAANGSVQSVYPYDKVDNRTNVVMTGTGRQAPAVDSGKLAGTTPARGE